MRKTAKRPLMPPRNYRRIQPCCCANCQHWRVEGLEELGAEYFCQRAPDEIAGDWNAMEPEFHVCDGHKREKGLEVVDVID